MSLLGKDVIYGLYNDEEDLLKAVKSVQADDLDILDVFTPFPVHGLDPLLGLAESRLHILGFVYGVLGCIAAFGFMTWALAADWPIIYGGKPYWPALSFIPVTFEVTVLFASVGMVTTFFIICGLGPGVENVTLDDRITDDKFCIAIDAGKYANKLSGIQQLFERTGASEINRKSFV